MPSSTAFLSFHSLMDKNLIFDIVYVTKKHCSLAQPFKYTLWSTKKNKYVPERFKMNIAAQRETVKVIKY